jgi:1,4-dihydroxy-2-naphthoyl-CoA hydrolase
MKSLHSIWKKVPTLEQLNSHHQGTIHDRLGIFFSAVCPQFLEATMPVDERTLQTKGFLHGGASVVLGESIGSIASYYVVDHDVDVFGLEINASHLFAVRDGMVKGRCVPIRIGNRIHVWDITIEHVNTHKDVSKIRLTTYVTAKK